MTNFQKLLSSLDACKEACEWAGKKTFTEVWVTCQRGDWMLWLAKNVGVELRPLTLAKGHCAELVLYLMTDEMSRNAVAVAIRYGEGNATDEELSAAYAAAYASDAYASAAAAAAYASAAAVYAAAYASDAYAYASASTSAYAAVYAAAAYASATSASAAEARRSEILLQCADICRRDMPAELIKAIHPEI